MRGVTAICTLGIFGLAPTTRAVARALGQDSQVLEVGPSAVTLLVRTTSLGLISSICKWVHALLTAPVCCDLQGEQQPDA